MIETKNNSIKGWAEDDRPREKMILKGINSLSDAELLAILISTGTRDESAVDLGKRVLQLTQNNLNSLGKLSLKELQKIKGIGKAKAITIAAALELGKRRNLEEAKLEFSVIRRSKDAFAYFAPILNDLVVEEFWVAYLNRSNRLIEVKRISEGGVSGTVADAKVIFKHAIDLLASTIILCHNHPSGNLQPSEADKQLTQKLVTAGKTLDVHVMDHLIIADGNYLSFADEGLI
ncbi:MAG: DNA repair protein RadC [Bacteroidia bacterium]|nr:DNA repair protein RadC [Bacteroidia bacterium]MCC7533135.1 DNA repair protein RadC [Bacteroidia bacterium]